MKISLVLAIIFSIISGMCFIQGELNIGLVYLTVTMVNFAMYFLLEK